MQFSVSLVASKKVTLSDVWILVASWATQAKNRRVILEQTRKEVVETSDASEHIVKVKGNVGLPNSAVRSLERSLLLFLRRHLPPPGALARSFETGFRCTGNFSSDSLRLIIQAWVKRWAKQNRLVYGYWLDRLQIFTVIRGGLTHVHVSGVFVLPPECQDPARISLFSALSAR